MGKLGKETRDFIYKITVVCVISFLFAFGISQYLAKEYQSELVLHDYAIAGYLMNHSDDLVVAAFTAETSADDLSKGYDALTTVGYSDTVSIKLFPAVLAYRNKTMVTIFILLLFIFGSIYIFVSLYLYRQHRAIKNAEFSIRSFLDGNTMSRIECEESGDWYSFFHGVNELSSILSAHAENEKKTKEFLQDIISDVSHQLKTPLSALKMYSEIISSHSEDSTCINNFSEKSLREIRRIEDVVYTLLKLARLDAGIIQMDKTQEYISVLMQDVLERFEVWAERDNKEIILSGKDNILLYCDALWFSEAVGNIIKNALEHTGKNGLITIRWEQTPLFTQIIIEDNGKGIHPEDLYNILNAFIGAVIRKIFMVLGWGFRLQKLLWKFMAELFP